MQIRRIISLAMIFSMLIAFNSYSRVIIGERGIEGYTEPGDDPKVALGEEGIAWTWLRDDLCIEYQHDINGRYTRDAFERKYSLGMIGGGWAELRGGSRVLKTRDIYTGSWSIDENEIWSFEFDDHTIPIELTRIDGVLYCFNSYGELREGNVYWNGQKTGADGVVTENSAEFLSYLESQYLPECSTKTE